VDLIKSIRDAGVVGAGGAGFPTHVKLDAKAEYIIINSAECEPLLRVDQQLICMFTNEIIQGVKVILEQTGAKKAFIAIKGKHKDEIEKIEAAIDDKRIEIFKLDDFYPAGDEQILVYEVVKRIVPEGSIPIKVGCIVINTETTLNVLNSITEIPVTDTYLTVTGMVAKPMTIKIPLGTSVRDVLEFCGIKLNSDFSVIDGGPMMGKILSDLDEPVTKTTKGLIVLPNNHQLIQRKSMSFDRAIKIARTACEQCRMCTDLCPRFLLGHNLQPHKMMRKVNYQYENLANAEMAFLCCECNLCELYACPINITPKSINSYYKKRLTESGMRFNPNENEYAINPTRPYRKVPVSRLIMRLGIGEFDKKAPLIMELYQPERVRILLKQHLGLAAVPVVSIGQLVNRGDVIAEIPDKALGARVHASITGIVSAIDQAIIIEGNLVAKQ
jgi:Na+-translocating ferredoxin:NAD+ oxidoreductase RnfC subunit